MAVVCDLLVSIPFFAIVRCHIGLAQPRCNSTSVLRTVCRSNVASANNLEDVGSGGLLL